jgi:predicted nucleotidyltransferase
MEQPSLTTSEREALEGFAQRLRLRFGDRVHSVILFGSKARGDSGPDSDIDVLVRLADDDPELRWDVHRLAARVSLEHDVLISVRVASRSQWDRLSRYRSPLYQALQTEGIPLTLFDTEGIR